MIPRREPMTNDLPILRYLQSRSPDRRREVTGIVSTRLPLWPLNRVSSHPSTSVVFVPEAFLFGPRAVTLFEVVVPRSLCATDTRFLP